MPRSVKSTVVILALLFSVLLCEFTPAAQSEAQAPEAVQPREKQEDIFGGLSTTSHSIRIGAETIEYTARAGYLRLQDETGKTKGNLFFVAYTREGAQDARGRPITFLFNGGPGAASVWLHMGAVGPRRVPGSSTGDYHAPPPRVIENQYTWLPFTDLVFIDPIGCGFSRPASGENPKQFHGINEDARSIGEFIRLYTTRFGRWLSPKFIAGESYGTFRAVGVADYLYENFGMEVNGLILISLALNFQTLSFELGNELPYVTFLPTYAAAALYHKKAAPDLLEKPKRTIEEVEEWAVGEYAGILMKGDAVTEAERNRIAGILARYTGLSEALTLEKNLRIDRRTFMTELLRGENRKLDIMDARASGWGKSDSFFDYPGIVRTAAPYTTALNDYLRNELKYSNDEPYIFLSEDVNTQWNWGSAIRGYVSVLEVLRNVMIRNESLKIFAAAGYYDLDTPYLGSRYSLDHLQLPKALRSNIHLEFYEAGHMFYTHEPSLEKLSVDVADYMKHAVPVR